MVGCAASSKWSDRERHVDDGTDAFCAVLRRFGLSPWQLLFGEDERLSKVIADGAKVEAVGYRLYMRHQSCQKARLVLVPEVTELTTGQLDNNIDITHQFISIHT